MENRTVRVTGLYGQPIILPAAEILEVRPHRVWTVITAAGGREIKVMEDGEEIRRRLEAAGDVQSAQESAGDR